MKKLFIALVLLGSFSNAFADEKANEINAKLERIESLSIAIGKRMHPEVMEALAAGDKEAILERLTAQEDEMKKINSQLREQFNQLSPEAQRDILLRQVKKD